MRERDFFVSACAAARPRPINNPAAKNKSSSSLSTPYRPLRADQGGRGDGIPLPPLIASERRWTTYIISLYILSIMSYKHTRPPRGPGEKPGKEQRRR